MNAGCIHDEQRDCQDRWLKPFKKTGILRDPYVNVFTKFTNLHNPRG